MRAGEVKKTGQPMRRKMGFRRACLTAGVVTAMLAVNSCGGSAGKSGTTSDKGPITFGMSAPLTGPLALYGAMTEAGVKTAIAEINSSGGINGRQVKFKGIDDAADPTKAVAAARELAGSVDVMFGPVTSQQVLAVLPIYTKANVLSMSLAGTSEFNATSAPYGFTVIPQAGMLGKEMADYALNELHVTRGATINDVADQGKSAASEISKAMSAGGGKVIASQEYQPGATDMTPSLLALRKANPQVLFAYASSAADAGTILQGLKQIGWDVPVIGSQSATRPEALQLGGAAVASRVKAVSLKAFTYCGSKTDSEQVKGFISHVVSTVGEATAKPLQMYFVSEFYDGAMFAAAAIKATHSTNGKELAQWILSGKQSNIGTINVGLVPDPKTHSLMTPASVAFTSPDHVDSLGLLQRAGC